MSKMTDRSIIWTEDFHHEERKPTSAEAVTEIRKLVKQYGGDFDTMTDEHRRKILELCRGVIKPFVLQNADRLIAGCVEGGITDEQFAQFWVWLDASERTVEMFDEIIVNARAFRDNSPKGWRDYLISPPEWRA
jgi:hypothetical protein